jgi:hypothetical protein
MKNNISLPLSAFKIAPVAASNFNSALTSASKEENDSKLIIPADKINARAGWKNAGDPNLWIIDHYNNALSALKDFNNQDNRDIFAEPRHYFSKESIENNKINGAELKEAAQNIINHIINAESDLSRELGTLEGKKSALEDLKPEIERLENNLKLFSNDFFDPFFRWIFNSEKIYEDNLTFQYRNMQKILFDFMWGSTGASMSAHDAFNIQNAAERLRTFGELKGALELGGKNKEKGLRSILEDLIKKFYSYEEEAKKEYSRKAGKIKSLDEHLKFALGKMYLVSDWLKQNTQMEAVKAPENPGFE